MNRSELTKRIHEHCYLSGQFTLRSGKTSSFYWDKYRFESDPILLDAIANEMLHLLPAEFDRLAGLELGGVPIATVLSQKTGKPCLFVRKEAKTYGTCQLAEGGFKEGEQIVAVEDVVTTAGQLCESVKELRALGLVVNHAVCVIDRQQGGGENLSRIQCSLDPLFKISDLE